MKKFQRMSDSEMEVMQRIWTTGSPITSAQILSGLNEARQWKNTTVLTFLSRLCDKGFLRIEKQGKQNLYYACLTEEEYRQMETRAFLQNVHNGSVKSFMAALAEEDGLSAEEIRELREWFEKR